MKDFQKLWTRYGTLGVFLTLVLLMGILSPAYFLTGYNLAQVSLQSSVTILIALGVFFTILIGGIDLSVGSIIALTGLATAKLLVTSMPVALAILLGGLVLGAFLGFINGSLTVKTGLHPFIITIGTQLIFRGLALVLSHARPVYGLPAEFTRSLTGRVLFLPTPTLIALTFALMMHFMTKKTIAGRNLYAIGGSREAAWCSGIAVNKHIILAFIISGTASGIAGVVLVSRLGAAEPLAGVGFETFAIASAIIGGTSFFGGIGSVFGVFMGGLIIGVINNGLNILNVPTFYQQIVMGSLIILSVFLDKIIASGRTR